ncbi:MAG: 2-amino-4-hydroxy-6-hydroxymethyldihydropteridine diphosphokinase [Sphingobacteriales bacterium]|jgi:2-amino-4-hydroxy-6-hydroxymethyldihydropteridine diphosphokinase|nr:2-amino-4-hydroxy-6-hydroxymethyldihydropteridine diphosphokinase [Sphingobacteriales bacterium]
MSKKELNHFNRAYLLLGSNLGNPKLQLENATRHISKDAGMLKRVSSIYTTAAWGNTLQPDFLNQVLVIDTLLTAEKLMQILLAIETKMGRIRTIKNEARTIDIDLLFYGKTVISSPSLTVPHPLIQERRFVLVPMNALSPRFIHPVFHKSIHQLLKECKDTLAVKKIQPT